MDEMKMKLSTGLMRGFVSKLIAGAIKKKYGYKVDIDLKDLNISFVDGETSISTSVEVKLDSKEFIKIVKSVGLD